MAQLPLKLGVGDGSLFDQTAIFFRESGINLEPKVDNSKKLSASRVVVNGNNILSPCGETNRPDVLMGYLQGGSLDLVIMGYDELVNRWYEKGDEGLRIVAAFGYAKNTLKPIRQMILLREGDELIDDPTRKVFAEKVSLTRAWLLKNNFPNLANNVEFYQGGVEGLVAAGNAHYCQCVVETGGMAKKQGLKWVEPPILVSPVVAVTRQDMIDDPDIYQYIRYLCWIFGSAVTAASYREIQVNVSDEAAQKCVAKVPALKAPTLRKLYDDSGNGSAGLDVVGIVNAHDFHNMMYILSRMEGVTDIVTAPVHTVAPGRPLVLETVSEVVGRFYPDLDQSKLLNIDF
ncbi:MAG: hypothetical protein PHT51_05120 [Patescibacteria group bacterium]|nr:hypothetical protein [Patescibacteria group bacterium]MDD4610852.1 hypothetical protein [Patescibacteria group bacterium]